MRILPVLFGGLFLAAMHPATLAEAAWPFASNVNVPVCTASGDQGAPVAVSDGTGGTIVVWADHRVSTARTEIFAQRIDASGTPLWAAGGVLVKANASVFTLPVAVSDGAGGAYVAWSTAPSGTYLAYAQYLGPAGVRQWDTTGVRLSSAGASQTNAVICADASGGAYVAWMDLRNGATPDVYAQRVGPAGTLLFGAAGLAVCTAANTQTELAVAPDGAGGLLVAWADFRGTDADIYAQRVASTGASAWAANGAPVAVANNDQRTPTVVADGLGGALLAWADERNTLNAPDVYGQRLNAAGSQAWIYQGTPITNVNGSQTSPVAVSDGAGGMIVAWQTDHNAVYSSVDIYAERIDVAGVTRWNSGGLGHIVTTYAGAQTAPRIATDGSGGAFIAWRDERGGGADVCARRVTSTGWSAGGIGGTLVCDAAGAQGEVAIAPDDRGGAVLAWTDARGASADVYAERLDHGLLLGDPTPSITAVGDEPGDEGGRVRLEWNPSDRDGPSFAVMSHYEVWREVPPASATFRALARSRGTTDDPDEAVRTGRLLVGVWGATDAAWEYVTAQLAGSGAPYSLVVATVADSGATGNASTAFMVQARGVDRERWPSAPMSGVSVDNLAPGVPQGFVGAYGTNSTHLAWWPSAALDFSHFELHRGASAAFVPGPASLVVSQPDTGYTDVVASPTSHHYKLVAYDVHGNASAPALVSPPSTGVTPAARAGECRLSPPAPNPARGRALVRFTLPAGGHARLALYDVAGRARHVLLDQMLGAGEHEAAIEWNGTGKPALASGLYLLRLETAGITRTQRLAVIR